MINRESDFFKLSKEVVEGFLQSAVIVDDRATFGEDLRDISPTRLVTPSRGSRRQANLNDQDTAIREGSESSDGNGSGNLLDAKKVIDSFAQKSIVCSVLRPYKVEMEALTGTLDKLANCADIIVIDWSLYKDHGEKALEMIERIVRSSVGSPARLRLIAIYTIDPRIVDISQQVKAILTGMAEEDVNADGKAVVQEENDGLTLTFGAARVTVLAKQDSNVPEQYHHRVVSFEDLADRVTEEFTVMTAGLVSNAALESLARVRQNAHKILSQFSADLDAPYLTHRALLGTPDEAEDFLTALVAEELQAILDESYVGSKAGLDAIKAWIEARKDKGISFLLPLEDGNGELTSVAGETLVEIGIEQTIQDLANLSKKQKKEVLRNAHKLGLTTMFSSDETIAETLDEQFAFITSMRSYYEHLPVLTSGTIVKEESEDGASYWVCIQPRCDCVRVGSNRVFPFLPLRVITGGNFDIILKEGDGYLRLLQRKKPYELKLIKFKPRKRDNGVVTAKKDGKTYYFQNTSWKKYIWVGELRREHAQRLSNQFAAILSRVGLDESEWLRLWATRGRQS